LNSHGPLQTSIRRRPKWSGRQNGDSARVCSTAGRFEGLDKNQAPCAPVRAPLRRRCRAI
jgi:hypothetical protein